MWLSFIAAAAFAAEAPVRPDLPPATWAGNLDASGDRLALGTSDGVARVFAWDGTPIATFDVGRYTPDVDLGDDGRLLLTRDDRGVVRIFDVDRGEVVFTRRPGSRWSTLVGALAEDERRWLVGEDYALSAHDGSASVSLGEGWGDPRTMGVREGQLWVPDGDGLRVGPISAWERGPTVPLPASPNRVRARADRLWVGTYEAGLHVVDPATGSARPVPVPGFPVSGPFDVTPDGRLVVHPADGPAYGAILVAWDLEAGRRAGAVDLGDARVDDLVIAPDGRRVALVADGRLEIRPLPDPASDADAAVLALGFSGADGAAWAVHADGRARTWTADGALATEAWLPIPQAAPLALRDGVAVWADGEGRLWRAALADGVATSWGNAGGPLTAIGVAADGAVAVLADGRLRTWTADGQPVLDREHHRWSEAIEVLPGGERAVVARDGTIGLVDANGVAWSVPYDGEILDLDVGSDVVALTSAKDLVRIGLDGTASTRPVGDGGAWYLADVHADGAALALDEYDGLWAVAASTTVFEPRSRPIAVDLATYAVAVDPGGQFALVASASGIERIDAEGGITVLTGRPAAFAVDVAGDAIVSTTSDARLWIGDTSVALPAEAYALEVSPDGATVAVGRADGVVSFHALEGALERETQVAEAPILDLAWSPDGGRVAVVADDGFVRVVPATERSTVDLEVPGDGAAWSPDGRLVVTDFLMGLTVVDATGARPNPKAKRLQRDLLGPIVACGDGSFALTPWLASKGGVLVLPDAEGRLRRVRVPEVGTTEVCAGSRIVARHWAGTIAIVDLDEGVVVEPIAVPAGDAFDVAALPDGRLVIAGRAGVEIR